MIEIPVVGSNLPALADDCWQSLVGYRWRLDRDGYVMRKAKGKRIYLHHVVLPGRRYPDFVRDHVNRNKLDNRANNLRWLTLAQSNQNRNVCGKNTTGQRGVMKIGARYRAVAYLEKVAHRLGRFDTAEQAGNATADWRARHMPFAA